MAFETRQLPERFDVLAPDGSEVRILLRVAGGSMAQFRLPPGQVSLAVVHRTVEELWYVIEGEGAMWRNDGVREEIADLCPGTCVSIPVGTRFQFRNTGAGPLSILGVTMPPWPGADEAVPVEGPWDASR